MIVRALTFVVSSLLLVAVIVGCKDRGATEAAPPDTTGGPVVRKPNIYLYPTESRRISVHLVFPAGGRILHSDPPYGPGWNVIVEPDGRIDGRYDYLFYEAQTPDRYQYSSGWIVGADTLSAFFTGTLTHAGFNNREIADFLDYWLPLLTSHPRYEVYPQQTAELDRLIQVHVSPAPQSRLRLFFVVRPARGDHPGLPPPRLPTVSRGSYHMSEWGGVLQ